MRHCARQTHTGLQLGHARGAGCGARASQTPSRQKWHSNRRHRRSFGGCSALLSYIGRNGSAMGGKSHMHAALRLARRDRQRTGVGDSHSESADACHEAHCRQWKQPFPGRGACALMLQARPSGVKAPIAIYSYRCACLQDSAAPTRLAASHERHSMRAQASSRPIHHSIRPCSYGCSE